MHISNTYQNTMIPIEKIYQFMIKVYIEILWYQFMLPIENKQNIFEIPIESKQNFKILKDTNWKYHDTNLKCLVNFWYQ